MNATHNTKSNNSILEIYARTKLYYDPHLQSTIRLWGAFISYNLKNTVSLNNFKISNSKQNKISYYFNFGSRILKILHSQLRLIQCTQTFYVSKKPL